MQYRTVTKLSENLESIRYAKQHDSFLSRSQYLETLDKSNRDMLHALEAATARDPKSLDETILAERERVKREREQERRRREKELEAQNRNIAGRLHRAKVDTLICLAFLFFYFFAFALQFLHGH
jgi:hypothetical protein